MNDSGDTRGLNHACDSRIILHHLEERYNVSNFYNLYYNNSCCVCTEPGSMENIHIYTVVNVIKVHA